MVFVKLSDLNFENYDVIIVGSGPAGTTLASRLVSAGKFVLLVETGKELFDPSLQQEFSSLQAYGNFDSSHWPTHWVRTLGGTSLIWGGWCIPLDERDLSTWPISLEELYPFYREAAGILDRNELFLDYKTKFIDKFYFKPISFNSPTRFASKFEHLFKNNDKLHVCLNTTLTKIYPNKNRTQVSEISLFALPDNRVDMTLRPNQALVLAAGGLGNAQLMLTPFDESQIGAGNENDMAGRCLMEHPHAYNAGRVILAPSLSLPRPPYSFGDFLPNLMPGKEIYDDIGRVATMVELAQTKVELEDPVENLIVEKLGKHATAYSLNLRGEMKPNFANRITLTHMVDPSSLRRMNVGCVVGSEELRAYHTCLLRFGELLAERGLGRLYIANDSLFRGIVGGGHTLGTTRMGEDAKSSVVDENCRVHGYRNYYVAGSSVFTTGGAANPTLTIVALAARLADHLIGVT